jgi:HAD superfamily hydrolase (TIGR01458 family)
MKDPFAARGFLLDLDGTVYEGHRLVPGTKKALHILRDLDRRFLFITNTTSRSRRQIFEKLRGLGIPCAVDEILTSPRTAAALLKDRGIERCRLLASETCVEDFRDLGVEPVLPGPPARGIPAVVVGDLGERFTFPVLNDAFHSLLDGALLVSMSPNRYWKAPEGLRLDAGPFVAALEYASGAEALVAAKPSSPIFLEGCRILGREPGQVVMVGDDAEVDIAGAGRAGLGSILVKTGKYRDGDEERFDPAPGGVVKNLLDFASRLPQVP